MLADDLEWRRVRETDHPRVLGLRPFRGVDPRIRGRGLGRALYERFFDVATAAGRTEIRAITGPRNVRSQDFHRRMGFTVSEPIADYDGPGQDRVGLHLDLTHGRRQ